MPICKRSANSRALLALAVLAAAPPPAGDPATDARDRLGRALAHIQDKTPALPPLPVLKSVPADRRVIQHAAEQAAADDEARARVSADLAAARTSAATQTAAMAERLHQALGISAPSIESVARVAAPGALHHVPLIFVSSSMPLDELRTYAAEVERTGGALAFRGMPGGLHRVAPMARLSAEILRRDPGCSGPACGMRNVPIVVDPIAFRAHGVTAVPALAMVPGDPTTPYCERDDVAREPDILVTGDSALTGLFDEYARLGGAKEVADAQARLAHR